jgi:hypothetical protein
LRFRQKPLDIISKLPKNRGNLYRLGGNRDESTNSIALEGGVLKRRRVAEYPRQILRGNALNLYRGLEISIYD